MMVGERRVLGGGSTVHVPPWSADDPIYLSLSPASATATATATAVDDYSLFLNDSLQRYLPSNTTSSEFHLSDFLPVEAQSCDHFRMFDFKVRKCSRGRSHDWTDCPFAHPGEKARRRDPRKFHYSGTACPDFRKGNCRKGDACDFAHGVFECWLHPDRYRTQPCKDGANCTRRVCFFAHSPDQLRVLSPRSESPRRPFLSLPDSPSVAALRQLRLSKSPRILPGYLASPTHATARVGVEFFEEERVESGRDLRAKMFEKLSKENPLDTSPDSYLDVGWVSELVK